KLQNPPPPRGSVTFDGRYSGHAFADFLLGDTSATAHVTKNLEAEPENSRYSAYIQDDWNVAPKLTLNLGLRYEFEGLFQNGRGDMANFYLDMGKYVMLFGHGDLRLVIIHIVNAARLMMTP